MRCQHLACMTAAMGDNGVLEENAAIAESKISLKAVSPVL